MARREKSSLGGTPYRKEYCGLHGSSEIGVSVRFKALGKLYWKQPELLSESSQASQNLLLTTSAGLHELKSGICLSALHHRAFDKDIGIKRDYYRHTEERRMSELIVGWAGGAGGIQKACAIRRPAGRRRSITLTLTIWFLDKCVAKFGAESLLTVGCLRQFQFGLRPRGFVVNAEDELNVGMHVTVADLCGRTGRWRMTWRAGHISPAIY